MAPLSTEQKVSELSLTDLERAREPKQEDDAPASPRPTAEEEQPSQAKPPPPERSSSSSSEYAVGERALAMPSSGCDPCDPRFGKKLLLSAGASKRRFAGNMVLLRRRKPTLIMGPYWLMLVFVTFPLVVVGPAMVAVFWCAKLDPWIQASYAAVALVVAGALLSTGLRDPGVLTRHPTAPANDWNWNDQAQTFKPPGARYCPWCDCVVTNFDHTCPWTGTAIGGNNIRSFRLFVGALQILAYYTVVVFVLGAFSSLAATRDHHPRHEPSCL